MPANPAVPNAVRSILKFRNGNNERMQNVLHWLIEAGATFDQAYVNALAEQLESAWTSHLQGFITDAVKFEEIEFQDMRSVPYLSLIATPDAVGGSGEDMLPAQVAAVLSLRAAVAGRSGRGRVFLGGFGVSGSSGDGAMANVLRTGILAFGTALTDIVDANGVETHLAVYSRLLGAVAQVTDTSADHRFDTQRRRANGR